MPGSTVIETPEQVAKRFGLPVEWARLHVGRHRCVDEKNYIYSCLVTDPGCDRVARSYMQLAGMVIPSDEGGEDRG